MATAASTPMITIVMISSIRVNPLWLTFRMFVFMCTPMLGKKVEEKLASFALPGCPSTLLARHHATFVTVARSGRLGILRVACIPAIRGCSLERGDFRYELAGRLTARLLRVPPLHSWGP